MFKVGGTSLVYNEVMIGFIKEKCSMSCVSLLVYLFPLCINHYL
jgi:hypothetical protein